MNFYKKIIGIVLLGTLSFNVTASDLDLNDLKQAISFEDVNIIEIKKEYESETVSTKIVNGTIAKLSDYPYYSRLVWIKETSTSLKYGQVCGSTLIDPNHVLTAAHCVVDDILEDYMKRDFNLYVVYNDSEEKLTYSDLINKSQKVKSVYSYPSYTTDTWRDDIAILELENDILSDVPYIERPNFRDNDYANSLEYYKIIGMGKTYNCDGNCASSVLLDGDIINTEDSYCSAVLSYSGINYANDGSAICTLPDYNSNICNGDSGGPLTYLDTDGKYKQIGIVSYGATDCTISSLVPSVFTNIYFYRDWIDNVILHDYNEYEGINYGSINLNEYKEQIDLTSEIDDNKKSSGGGGSLGFLGLITLIGVALFRRKKIAK